MGNTYISVSLVKDGEMKKLNKEYLGRNYTTDVLSFEIKEKQKDGTLYLGDIVVNTDQAKRQAKEYGNDLEEEISELVGHGVLHLLGVHHEGDDNTPKKNLEKAKEKFEENIVKGKRKVSKKRK